MNSDLIDTILAPNFQIFIFPFSMGILHESQKLGYKHATCRYRVWNSLLCKPAKLKSCYCSVCLVCKESFC